MSSIYVSNLIFLEVIHVTNSVLTTPPVLFKTFVAQTDYYAFIETTPSSQIKDLIIADLGNSRTILKIKKL